MFSAAITLVLTGFPLAVIVLTRHFGATPSLTGMILGISAAGGLLGALLALVPSALALIPVTAGIAVIGQVLAVVSQTRRARLIPRHLLGRVYSVSLVISGSTAPLGSLLTGFLLSWLGGPATCTVLGGGLLIIATTATANPTIRHADLPKVTAS